MSVYVTIFKVIKWQFFNWKNPQRCEDHKCIFFYDFFLVQKMTVANRPQFLKVMYKIITPIFSKWWLKAWKPARDQATFKGWLRGVRPWFLLHTTNRHGPLYAVTYKPLVGLYFYFQLYIYLCVRISHRPTQPWDMVLILHAPMSMYACLLGLSVKKLDMFFPM